MKPFFKMTFIYAMIAALPYVILLGTFFIQDPYRLTTYPPYTSGRHAINRGVVTTNGYLEKEGINSLILGNSRSMAIRCDDWVQLNPNCSDCFHFDASEDNIFGFQQKAQLLHDRGDSISHVLIVLDESSLRVKPFKPREMAYIRHPIFQEFGPKTKTTFYSVFIKQYLNFRYQWEHIFKSNSKSRFVQKFDHSRCEYNQISGDYISANEQVIKSDSTAYYSQNSTFNNQPEHHYYDISAEKIMHLTNVIDQLHALGAHCKILFQPRWTQSHPSHSALDKLSKALPTVKIYDASHYHNILKNPGYWYEQSHFRPMAGRLILEAIAKHELTPHALQQP